MDNFNIRMHEAGIDPGAINYNRAGFQRLRTFDKPGKRNGAVVVLNQRPLRVWYQNHATGITGVASEDGSVSICRAEWERIQAARKAEQGQRDATQRSTAQQAENGWNQTDLAEPTSPYLVRKGVQPHGLHQTEDGYLLVALRCAGLIWNLQTISPEGEKRFLPGGRKAGCWFSIGSAPAGTLLLAEGFATGASLHEALGLPVAVAFDAGNLVNVGQILRARYPRAELLYAVDNDVRTPGNPGVSYGTKAAAMTRGRVVVPQFGPSAIGSSDWNDYANWYGLDAVRQCFREVLRHGG